MAEGDGAGGTGGAGSSGNAGGTGGDGGSGGAGGGDSNVTFFTKDNWRSAVNPELASHASLANHKDLDSVIKSYIHAQKLVGADKIPVPKNAEDKEAWEIVYNKLGRPDKPENYEFGQHDLQKLGTTQEKYDLAKSEFSKKAHNLGLTKAQAAALWNDQADKVGKNLEQRQAQVSGIVEQNKAKLQEEFGAKLPEVAKLAERAVLKYGGEELAAIIKADPTTLTNPIVIRTFYNIAKDMGESKILIDERNSGALSPSEAKSKINAMLADNNSALNDRKHPGHDDAVKEYQRLHALVEAGNKKR